MWPRLQSPKIEVFYFYEVKIGQFYLKIFLPPGDLDDISIQNPHWPASSCVSGAEKVVPRYPGGVWPRLQPPKFEVFYFYEVKIGDFYPKILLPLGDLDDVSV